MADACIFRDAESIKARLREQREGVVDWNSTLSSQCLMLIEALEAECNCLQIQANEAGAAAVNERRMVPVTMYPSQPSLKQRIFDLEDVVCSLAMGVPPSESALQSVRFNHETMIRHYKRGD